MQRTLTQTPLVAIDSDATPAFNVVIAYENFETGKRAKCTYDYLVENLGRDCYFSNQMWKFDVLTIPKLREIAVKDACTADIIIVSCCGTELPGQVKTWVESWLMEAKGVLALVALFAPSHDESPGAQEIRSYLAAAATRGGIEFFAQPQPWPSPEREPRALPQHNAQLNQRTLSTLAGVVERDLSPPRWGINE